MDSTERTLGRIEGKLESVHSDIAEIKKAATLTNSNVLALQKIQWKRDGAIVVVSFLISTMTSLICAAIASGWIK